jgi:hypothetical protein
MWHITCDTWNVTCDTWHVTCCGGWTFFKNFISLTLTVCDLWYYEDLEEKAHGINQWINHKAVYQTAPATPGLLIIVVLQLLLIQLCYTLLVQTHLPLHLQFICHCICNSFANIFAVVHVECILFSPNRFGYFCSRSCNLFCQLYSQTKLWKIYRVPILNSLTWEKGGGAGRN